MSSEHLAHPLVQPLDTFAELLNLRLQCGAYTEERAVVFTLCYALIQAGFKLEEMILEASYAHIKAGWTGYGQMVKPERECLDLLISPVNGRKYAVECKYDQHDLAGGKSKSQQRMGRKFPDIFRLARLHPTKMETIFVYVANPEIVHNFREQENMLGGFFDLKIGADLKIDDSTMPRDEIFRKNAGDITPCVVTMLFSRSLLNNRELRVYRVRATDSGVVPDTV